VPNLAFSRPIREKSPSVVKIDTPMKYAG